MTNTNDVMPAREGDCECVYRVDVPEVLHNRVSVQRILVIRLRHIGDVLLTTPLLQTLRLNYPNALIDVLVYQGTEAVISADPVINHIYTVDRNLKKQGVMRQLQGEYALLQQLKQPRYDLILNISDQWRAAAYCRLLKPVYSIGLWFTKRDHPLWRYCHSAVVKVKHFSQQHTVLNNLSILYPLALPALCDEMVMSYREEDQQRVDRLCQQHNLRDYILIQPTARWAFKTWSVAAYTQLINALTAKGEQIVLTGGKSPDEMKSIVEIMAGCEYPERVCNLAGELELRELAVFIQRSRLFIGVDSVPMHMAAALKTPSVVLFGPTNLRQWHPWKSPYTLLWAGDYRSLPGTEEVDTETQECYLDAIPVEDVLQAVNSRLHESRLGFEQ